MAHRNVRRLGTPVMLLIALLSSRQVGAIEQPSYEVLEQSEGMEIRRYEAQIVARTLVEGDLNEAGNTGFRRLANYIFGGNESAEKIAMTAPVLQTPQVEAETSGKYWIVFHMPAEYELKDLPVPEDALVELVSEPEKTVAVLRYRGGWSESRYREHEAKLEALIAEHPLWRRSGAMGWARYDPPFMPWFARTNEVAVQVERIQGSVAIIEEEESL